MTDREPHIESGDVTPADVTALRRALASAERRAATLAELTALMSEGRHPHGLAQRAVELTARATRAHGAFVYLWDRDEELLVLRAATEGRQRRSVDHIKLRLGEGLTGWSALMRSTVVVQDDPCKDPRFKAFPELRESSFKSMIAVPIVAPGQEVLGVFTLYGRSPDAFEETDVNLASEVGSLLASGLVQAETVTALEVQSAAARFLSDLPDEAWGSQEQTLRLMAAQCALHLEADICITEVTSDRSEPHGTGTVIAFSAPFKEAHPELTSRRIADRSATEHLIAPLGLHRLRIPLAASGPIGALTCYRSRRFTPEDERLLEAIGAQIAAGALSLFGRERVRPVLAQLVDSSDPASTERLLRRFGWSPRPTWPAVIRIQPGSANDPLALDDERVRSVVLDVLHGDRHEFVVLGGGGSYLALVSSDDHARHELATRINELARRPGLRVVSGFGPRATESHELHYAIKHAFTASHWAALVGTSDSSVVKFEEIAHLRLLPRVALSMGQEIRELQDALCAVVIYDLENDTDLAVTLDAFLGNRGSVTRTAAQLFIHRNTLRQRIQRIEEIVGRSPEDFADWVTAGIAARLVRQSEVELTAGTATRSPARCPLGTVTVGRGCCRMPHSCVLGPTTAGTAT